MRGQLDGVGEEREGSHAAIGGGVGGAVGEGGRGVTRDDLEVDEDGDLSSTLKGHAALHVNADHDVVGVGWQVQCSAVHSLGTQVIFQC